MAYVRFVATTRALFVLDGTGDGVWIDVCVGIKVIGERISFVSKFGDVDSETREPWEVEVEEEVMRLSSKLGS